MKWCEILFIVIYICINDLVMIKINKKKNLVGMILDWNIKIRCLIKFYFSWRLNLSICILKIV